MGLQAEVIAIGQFSQTVIAALEYGPSFYTGVAPGQTVLVHVFLAATSSDSHKLAEAFSIGAMDLGNHHLNPRQVDIEKLTVLFGELEVEKFKLLRDNGFNFYYAPNA